MTENIVPIICVAAFIVLMALGLYHVHKLRKPTLRELCRREYGDWFVECMDTLCDGRPIGGLNETVAFLDMLEKVKSEHIGEWR